MSMSQELVTFDDELLGALIGVHAKQTDSTWATAVLDVQAGLRHESHAWDLKAIQALRLGDVSLTAEALFMALRELDEKMFPGNYH